MTERVTMNRPKQFPRWLQQTIVVVAVFGGAWYVIAGMLRWWSQLLGAG